MSSFTVGIASLGGLVLAALVAWNAWTTRRNAPRQPDGVQAAPAGPLADAGVTCWVERVLWGDDMGRTAPVMRRIELGPPRV